MASRIVARVERNQFPQARARLEAGINKVVATTAANIERGMTNDVAVDTGDLKRSIQSLRTSPANWMIRVGMDYGIYVEFGTVNTPAQPFVFPNVERQRPAFIAAVRAVGRSL